MARKIPLLSLLKSMSMRKSKRKKKSRRKAFSNLDFASLGLRIK